MTTPLIERRELMEMLVSVSVVSGSGHGYSVVGIVVPSFSEAKRFSKDLNSVLEEVPEWLRPKLYSRTIRSIEFENGFKICILYSDICSKGMTLDALYASSRVKDEQMSVHRFSMIKHGFTRFEDSE